EGTRPPGSGGSDAPAPCPQLHGLPGHQRGNGGVPRRRRDRGRAPCRRRTSDVPEQKRSADDARQAAVCEHGELMIETRSSVARWTVDDSDVQTLTALMGVLTSVGPRARVLIVDDDRQNRELLARILTKEAYDVETAADGETALLSVELKLPDLILLDVH